MKAPVLVCTLGLSLLLPAHLFAEKDLSGGGFKVRALGASAKVRMAYGPGTNNWLTISPRTLIEAGSTGTGKHPQKLNRSHSFAPLRFGAGDINVTSNDCGVAVAGSISASTALKIQAKAKANVTFTAHFGASCESSNLVACEFPPGTNCVALPAGTPEVQISLSVSNWPFASPTNTLTFDVPLNVPDGSTIFGNSLNNFVVELPDTAVVDGVVTPIAIKTKQQGQKLDLQFVFPAFKTNLVYN